MNKIMIPLIMITLGIGTIYFFNNIDLSKIKIESSKKMELKEQAKKKERKSITLSAVGDCTIGSDPKFGYERTFHQMYDKKGASWFFSGVSDILTQDDITLANLETTFTDSNERIEKKFNFKGPRKYTEILSKGSVEIVNIANNHILDYGSRGYSDTKVALKDAHIPFVGNEDYYIYEIKGIKVGFIGYYANYNDTIYQDVQTGLESLKKEKVDLIIVSFHWGKEKVYNQNDEQKKLGRWAIDNGADLIIGHHPHVVQGIENYKGKYIVYSLGNFVFGGNSNPSDKDTFIFQQIFNYEGSTLINTEMKVIPASLSSVRSKNDYKPIILEGNERTRVLRKIQKYSENIELY